MPTHTDDSLTIFGSNTLQKQRSIALKHVREQTTEVPPEVIESLTEDEYARYIVEEYGFESVNVNYEGVTVERSTSPRQPKYIHLPANGNLELLKYNPGTRPRIPYEAEIVDGGYRIRVKNHGQHLRSSENLQEAIETMVEHIQQQHEALEDKIEDFHETLRSMAKKRYNNRQHEIRQQTEMLDELEYPVRKREEIPDVLDIDTPEKRERINIEKHKKQSDPTKRVPQKAYLEILSTIDNLGRAFERRPALFSEYGEEDLRDLLLFFLEENFRGSATGETFNKEGKTDIMLLTESEPVFVAECAIWDGPKTLTKKIDQLITNYLTWRDSKAAVILFVGRKEFESILNKIPETVESHASYVASEGQQNDSWWQYTFELPEAPGTEISLGVQAYHVPTIE